MIVNVNMSKEVFEYFKDCNLDDLINTLLTHFSTENLPKVSGKLEIERKVNVYEERYLTLYKLLGPRSKRVSLARLLEFAYFLNILEDDTFEIKRHEPPSVHAELNKAYKILLNAVKLRPDDKLLSQLTQYVGSYSRQLKGEESGEIKNDTQER